MHFFSIFFLLKKSKDWRYKFRLVFVSLFMLCGIIIINAQDIHQASILRKQTDLNGLKTTRKQALKVFLSPEKLKQMAREKGWVYQYTEDEGSGVLVGVTENGLPLYIGTTNHKAAITSGADVLKNTQADGGYSLSGKGIRVLVVDDGAALFTHQELAGRVVSNASKFGGHATHVTGTIIARGVDANAEGMAPAAFAKNLYYDMPFKRLLNGLDLQEGILSNHSYGLNAGWKNISNGQWNWYGDPKVSNVTDYKFGFYGNRDYFLDKIIYHAPWHLALFAAGNSRGYKDPSHKGSYERNGGDLGYDCIPTGNLGKNILTIGAVNAVMSYQGPESVKMSDFSSWGPTDDGRIKPDLVNLGIEVYSSGEKGDSEYYSSNGTSMSTPSTTGALALVQEYAHRETGKFLNSYMLKALAIHTAKEAGTPGPDYIYGWGLLDSKALLDLMDLKLKNQGRIYSDYKDEKIKDKEEKTYTYEVSGNEPLKVSIAWLDRPGKVKEGKPDPSFLNDRTPKLVDDLDLRVIDAQGNEHKPWILDVENPKNPATQGDNKVDNIEQVYVASPIKGPITIKVNHKGKLPDQGVRYGLVVSGLSISKDVEVAELKQTSVFYNLNKTEVIYTIKNKGIEPLTSIKLDLKVNDPAGLNKQFFSKEIESLAPKEELRETFLVDLPKNYLDTYVVKAQVTAEGDENPKNNKQKISVKSFLKDLRPPGSVFRSLNAEGAGDQGWTMKGGKNSSWYYENTTKWSHLYYNISKENPSDPDSWLISPPIHLKKGVKYYLGASLLKLIYLGFNKPSDQVNMRVWVGPTKDIDSMEPVTSFKIPKENDEISVFKNKEDFIVCNESDTIVHIGLQHYTNPGEKSHFLGILDFTISSSEKSTLNRVDFAHSKLEGPLTTGMPLRLQNQTDSIFVSKVKKWKWEIYPKDYMYVNETDSTHINPKVVFKKKGSYSVFLTAEDDLGNAIKEKKYNYLKVVSPTSIQSGLYISKNLINQGQNVFLSDASIYFDDKSSVKYKWEISPSDGVEYLENTNEHQAQANVQFKKAGKHKVSLITSNDTGSWQTPEQEIEVINNYKPVENLSGVLNEKQTVLQWQKPDVDYTSMFPAFKEDFLDSASFKDKGWLFFSEGIKNEEDNHTWKFVQTKYRNYLRLERQVGDENVIDGLVSPLISVSKQTERLFMYYKSTNENSESSLRVFYLPNPQDNVDVYNIEKYGILIFSEDASKVSEVLKKEIDFSHYIKPEHKNFRIVIQIFNDENLLKSEERNSVFELHRFLVAKKDYYTSEFLTHRIAIPLLDGNLVNLNQAIDRDLEKSPKTKSVRNQSEEVNPWKEIPFKAPILKHYRITRDGGFLFDVPADKKADLSYTDADLQEGMRYRYEVSAVYQDGGVSEPRAFVVNVPMRPVVVDPVPPADAKWPLEKPQDDGNGLNKLVYLYPTVVKEQKYIEVLNASGGNLYIYDVNGRLVLQRAVKENKARIGVDALQKGVYLTIIEGLKIKYRFKWIKK